MINIVIPMAGAGSRFEKAGYKIALASFWLDHHQTSERERDSEETEKIKQRHSEYFRKKFKLGEFAE